MDEFQRAYAQLCKEGGSDPQEMVLQRLQEVPGRSCLDFSAQSLTLETCGVLGKLLQDETVVTKIMLSDCMLSEEGAKLLLHGLCSNTVVKSLDLKVTLLLAPLGCLWDLTLYDSPHSLALEWNSLGVWEESFSLFCEGLGANCSLQQLDLRNNQINHQGAEELALGLKCNSSLQELDLRWNNIGLLGGRALLDCLHSNRTLQKLELVGNNVPSDILKAVEQALEHNWDRQSFLAEKCHRTHILSQEVLCLKEEKAKQFLDLMGTIDKQLSCGGCTRNSACPSAPPHAWNLSALTAGCRLQLTEAALVLSEQKVHDLGELLSTAKQERASFADSLFKELRQHKQEAADREAKLLCDLSAANEKKLLLQNQVDELKSRCKGQQEQLFQVKQDLTHTVTELKLQSVQAKERLEMEKKRFKQGLEDAESLRLKEVDYMMHNMEVSEHSMRERIQKLETIRIGLEEELSQVKAATLTERGQAEEELMKARSQARLEEQRRLDYLEEKLKLMMQSRDEAQSYCLQQKQVVAKAHAEGSQLSLQIEELKRRVGDLQQELSSKEQEKAAEVNKVRVELQEQIGHLEAERAAQDGLREKIAAVERQLKVLSSNHRETVLDKEGEISTLLEKLRIREMEISRMREEEAQRASFLQNAVMAYMQGSPFGAHSPRK
uniref:Leucine rich repeat containing 45 n=1 Tax=Sphenodon punctatus TaxID=8508 RepID=A0A8D0GIS5_SPHPU